MFRSWAALTAMWLALAISARGADPAGSWRETRAWLQTPGLAKVRTRDPQGAAQARAAGGKMVADYGAFQIFALPAPQAAWLQAEQRSGLSVEDEVIHLNAGPLRTAEVARALPNVAYTGRRLHVVQFAGPPQPAWLAALEATGAQIVCYLPSHSYLVYAADTSARLLADVQGAQWQAEFAPAWKIARPLRKARRPRAAAWYSIQLVRDDAANAATFELLDRLRTAPLRRQGDFQQYRNVVAFLAPSAVAALAQQPEVVSIQPYAEPVKSDERQALIAAGSLTKGAPLPPAGPGGVSYLAWLAAKGFTQAQFEASGFLVDVSDSGLDNGTTAPNHFALFTSGLRPGISRVGYVRLEGTPHPGSSIQGVDGHGTLNAHIIAGYDGGSGAVHQDADGFRFGLGLAPFVRVGSSVIFDPDEFTEPDFADLQSRAYRDGARISSNSWGAPVGGAYTADAQIYDALVRDAQPAGAAVPAAGNQEMVIVFSAGNEGPIQQSITAPGTAKNVLTVGASEGVQSFGGADLSGVDDDGADDAEQVAEFSSRGPCADGRAKPELVAPGTHISGGVWQVANPSASGTADPNFGGANLSQLGISGGPTSAADFPFWPAGQQFFSASSGTSHAAPAVAGAAALLRQRFINDALPPPSPAMTKAFLINAARALPFDELPSPVQGMGRLDLGRGFDGVPRVLRDQAAADTFTASGQVRKFVVEVANPALPVRVSLAWTDAPGSTVGAAYCNDLDLTVTSGTQTYLGNVLQAGESVAGGQADRRNNHENVLLPAGIAGRVLVTVTAAGINAAAIPGQPGFAQDFALVVYNANAAPPTAFVVPAGTALVAESSTPNNGRIDPGEEVSVALAVRNVGNAASAPVSVSLTAGGGVLQPSGSQDLGSLAPDASAPANFTFTAAPQCSPVEAVFQLDTGSGSPAAVSAHFETSAPNYLVSETFDATSVPALPSGWSTAASGVGALWTTSATRSDSSPNAAFAPDADGSGTSDLLSPSLTPQTASAVLSFRHQYDLDAYPGGAFDGAILELSIGAGPFVDALDAGGVFLAGGYDSNLFQLSDNPISSAGARPVWALASPGFVTTRFQLPAAAAGQSVRFRWRIGTDSSNLDPFAGWFVDNIALQDGTVCSPASAGLSLQVVPQSVAPAVVAPGAHVTYAVTVVNLGPQRATGIQLSDQLPAGTVFVSASASQGSCSQQNGSVTASLGGLNAGQSATITIVVKALAGSGPLLVNAATVSAIQADGANADNSSSASAHLDTDTDGIPDDYELAHGWNPADPADATRDDDGDGASNLQEFLAGTDPQNAASVFRVVRISRNANDVVVRFTSVSGRGYRLERTATLTGGSWMPLGPVLNGTGGEMEAVDTGADAAGAWFYRVRGW